MVFSVTVFPPAAAGAALLVLPPAAGVLATADELPELAQAETVRAKAARPAAPHIFRIGVVSPSQMHVLSRYRSRAIGQFSSPRVQPVTENIADALVRRCGHRR